MAFTEAKRDLGEFQVGSGQPGASEHFLREPPWRLKVGVLPPDPEADHVRTSFPQCFPPTLPSPCAHSNFLTLATVQRVRRKTNPLSPDCLSPLPSPHFLQLALWFVFSGRGIRG